jgi:hypothetical protein
MFTYEHLLAQQPPSDSSGNRAAAAAFVVILTTALEGTNVGAGLSAAQKNYLYRLRATWAKRAAGTDLRWNVAGSRPGRPKKGTGGPKQRKPDPGEATPLFQSLMRKYGGRPTGDPE